MAGPDDPFNCFVGRPVVMLGRTGGLSVAVKDNFEVAGLPTGAGLGRAGPVAVADAAAVRLLRDAGLTLVGKAMMDEAALGGTGCNPHHGVTQNPRSPGHSCGGSSGGVAAAVASGRCAAGLGTDTLGSARIPASYCGVVGLKPSRGLVPLQGVVPLSPSLDHAGLLGATVGAVAGLLEVVGGMSVARGSPGRLRVGVPDALDAVAMDAPTRAGFAAALGRMRRLGWEVEPCAIEGWEPGRVRRSGLLLAEAEGAEVHAALLRSGSPALSDEVCRLLAYGRDCCPGRMVQARRTLLRATAGLRRCLERFDLVATPTVPSRAFAWADGPPRDQADLTALANPGGEPAISVPLPVPQGERAVGLQLIGRVGGDAVLLRAAEALEALGE